MHWSASSPPTKDVLGHRILTEWLGLSKHQSSSGLPQGLGCWLHAQSTWVLPEASERGRPSAPPKLSLWTQNLQHQRGGSLLEDPLSLLWSQAAFSGVFPQARVVITLCDLHNLLKIIAMGTLELGPFPRVWVESTGLEQRRRSRWGASALSLCAALCCFSACDFVHGCLCVCVCLCV
jgi:hypothetical protein